MKKLSQKFKDGKRDIQEKFPREKFPRLSKTPDVPNERTTTPTPMTPDVPSEAITTPIPKTPDVPNEAITTPIPTTPDVHNETHTTPTPKTLDVFNETLTTPTPTTPATSISGAPGKRTLGQLPPALQSTEYLHVRDDPADDIGHDSATELDLDDDFDLTTRAARNGELYTLERKSLLIFSKVHMRIILRDFKLLRKFAAFLVEERPERVQLLVYHLDCRKALAALNFSNQVAGGLNISRLVPEGVLGDTPPGALDEELRKRADESFHLLASEDLPAWVTSVWVKAVEVSIRMRITGSLPRQLRE